MKNSIGPQASLYRQLFFIVFLKFLEVSSRCKELRAEVSRTGMCVTKLFIAYIYRYIELIGYGTMALYSNFVGLVLMVIYLELLKVFSAIVSRELL